MSLSTVSFSIYILVVSSSTILLSKKVYQRINFTRSCSSFSLVTLATLSIVYRKKVHILSADMISLRIAHGTDQDTEATLSRLSQTDGPKKKRFVPLTSTVWMWRAWEHLHTQATTRSVRKALLSPEHKSRVTTDRPARTSVALQPSANEQALPGGAHTLPNNPFRSEIVIHLVQTRKIIFVDQFSPGKDGWWIYRLMPPGWWNVEIRSLCSLLEIR